MGPSLTKLAVLFVFLAQQAALAAENPPTQETGKVETAENEPAKDERIKTLVVRIEARRQVDPELALALESVVQSSLMQDQDRLVFGQEDLKRIFEFEGERQALGCADSGCLAEFANALDADRLIMGTMDKMGNSYLVVLIEIDGKNLKPIVRVQETISKEEDVLVAGVQKLTLKLMRENTTTPLMATQSTTGETQSAAGHATKSFAAAGSVSLKSIPSGAEVIIDGQDMGKTPVKLHNLQAGNVHIDFTRKNYQTVRVETPIFQAETTEVTAELLLAKKPARKAHRIRMETYNKRRSAQKAWGGGKLACGTGLCLVGGGAMGVGESAASAGLLFAGTGLATAIWGIFDFMKKSEPPIPDWELNRQIRIKPPKENGKIQLVKTKNVVLR